MISIMEGIGVRIKDARLRRSMTQDELARAIGTTKQNIYKYETGIITNIPLDRIEAISRALDVSTAYLMGWEEKSKPPEDNGNITVMTRAMRSMTPEEQKKLIDVGRLLFEHAFGKNDGTD